MAKYCVAIKYDRVNKTYGSKTLSKVFADAGLDKDFPNLPDQNVVMLDLDDQQHAALSARPEIHVEDVINHSPAWSDNPHWS